eukprot:357392-Chlamydomonas_euryale.AAC.52
MHKASWTRDSSGGICMEHAPCTVHTDLTGKNPDIKIRWSLSIKWKRRSRWWGRRWRVGWGCRRGMRHLRLDWHGWGRWRAEHERYPCLFLLPVCWHVAAELRAAVVRAAGRPSPAWRDELQGLQLLAFCCHAPSVYALVGHVVAEGSVC